MGSSPSRSNDVLPIIKVPNRAVVNRRLCLLLRNMMWANVWRFALRHKTIISLAHVRDYHTTRTLSPVNSLKSPAGTRSAPLRSCASVTLSFAFIAVNVHTTRRHMMRSRKSDGSPCSANGLSRLSLFLARLRRLLVVGGGGGSSALRSSPNESAGGRGSTKACDGSTSSSNADGAGGGTGGSSLARGAGHLAFRRRDVLLLLLPSAPPSGTSKELRGSKCAKISRVAAGSRRGCSVVVATGRIATSVRCSSSSAAVFANHLRQRLLAAEDDLVVRRRCRGRCRRAAD